MDFYKSNTYNKSITKIAESLPNEKFSILVTGASGLIGSCIIDSLMAAKIKYNRNYIVYAVGRNINKLKNRFNRYTNQDIVFLEHDVCKDFQDSIQLDYIIHAASNADPNSYALYPAETLLTNILGTKNILELAKNNKKCRVLLTSTFEVYGKIKNQDEYAENEFGCINFNEIRSCYPESKRSAELLLRCYQKEYGVDVVIARLCSIYGPTMIKSDNKAHAQFIRNALNGENIVLKSKGEQKRTYAYVMDVVSAIFKILFDGKNGQAYNVANEHSVVTIAEVAQTIAEVANTKVVFDLPTELELQGFSKPQNCVLNNLSLKKIGWCGKYSLADGIQETLDILNEIQCVEDI